MKNSEIKQFSDKELIEKIDLVTEELQKMKINHAVSPLENPLRIQKSRKNIAKLKTELRQRELQKK